MIDSLLMSIIHALWCNSSEVLAVDILRMQSMNMSLISWNVLSLELVSWTTHPCHSILYFIEIWNSFCRVHKLYYICCTYNSINFITKTVYRFIYKINYLYLQEVKTIYHLNGRWVKGLVFLSFYFIRLFRALKFNFILFGIYYYLFYFLVNLTKYGLLK